MTKDLQLQIEATEKANVAKILINNYTSQCFNVGSKTLDTITDEDKMGIQLTSAQLTKFINDLISSNYQLQLEKMYKEKEEPISEVISVEILEKP